MSGPGLTEVDLYDYKKMCEGKWGPQWSAIRKLVAEVKALRRDLMETKPAGLIRNNDLDSVETTTKSRSSKFWSRSRLPIQQRGGVWVISSTPSSTRRLSPRQLHSPTTVVLTSSPWR